MYAYGYRPSMGRMFVRAPAFVPVIRPAIAPAPQVFFEAPPVPEVVAAPASPLVPLLIAGGVVLGLMWFGGRR